MPCPYHRGDFRRRRRLVSFPDGWKALVVGDYGYFTAPSVSPRTM
jgi:hypothetical protein